MNLRFYLVLVSLLSSFSGQVSAQKKLSFAYTHFPPFVTHQKNAEPRGILSEYFIPMMESCKIPVEFHFYPAKRIVKILKEGKSDICVSVRSFFHSEHYLVGKQSMLSLPYSLYYLSKEMQVNSLAELRKDESLVIPLGYHLNGESRSLKQRGIRIDNSSTHKGTIRMLLAGRVNYMLNYDKMVSFYSQSEEFSPLLRTPISSTSLHVAVLKKHRLASKWIDCLSEQYIELEKNGELTRIFRKHFERMEKEK